MGDEGEDVRHWEAKLDPAIKALHGLEGGRRGGREGGGGVGGRSGGGSAVVTHSNLVLCQFC